MSTLVGWSRGGRSVRLRLSSEHSCAFVREATRKEESRTQNVTTVKGVATITEKVVTTITEYFWDFTATWELCAYPGSAPEEKVVLGGRTGTHQLLTTVKNTPHPSSTVNAPLDVFLTPLLKLLTEANAFAFDIDRSSPRCRTPSNNPEVLDLLAHLETFRQWSQQVSDYFTQVLFPKQRYHSLDLSLVSGSSIFVPLSPFFVQDGQGSKRAPAGPSGCLAEVLPSPDLAGGPLDLFLQVPAFLKEHKASINAKFNHLRRAFPDTAQLITFSETALASVAQNALQIINTHRETIHYIEHVLRQQLLTALGKELTPVDFALYMLYHNRLLFKEDYEPRPLCYPIRRPGHYPEGLLTVSARLDDGSVDQPLFAMSHHSLATTPMSFPLSASASLSFRGDRYLHAFVQHKFSGQAGLKLFLSARAHQFSSFVLVLGTLKSATSFDAKSAVIIQNKDDLLIPLLLEEIPTPKAFRDAIESLSPEQQRFAKAYRGMQLSSTLFGVVVIQIKPQLEKLLKLPNESLTKEIQLYQDLLKLFIKYQIPSDLLTFGGAANSSVGEKVGGVQRNVRNMLDMVETKQKEEIKEQSQVFLTSVYNSPPPPPTSVYLSMPMAYPSPPPMPMMSMMMAGPPPPPPTSSYAMAPPPPMAFSAPPPPMAFSAPPPMPSSMAFPSPPPPSRSAAGPPPPGGAAPPPSRSAAGPPPPGGAAPPPSGGGRGGAPPPKPKPAPAPQPSAPTKPTPQPTPSTPEQPLVPQKEFLSVKTSDRDLTKVPTELDGKFEALDEDAALHSVIISAGPTWNKKFRKSLLSKESEETLAKEEQEEERDKAFDLLDALSRSGTLEVDCAEMHVIIGASHNFDKNIINTVVQDNMNPIEKIERSMLIIATTVQGVDATELVKPEQLERVSCYSPTLFGLPSAQERQAIEGKKV
uniref:Uncharacterized protein n=1 Tax=Arcella intermedia TaxID=1963864 RepID=A0A6B2KX34_9EUKA